MTITQSVFNTTSSLVFVCFLSCLLTLFCFIVANVSFWFDAHQQVQYNVNCFKLFHLNACINFTCLISCFFSEDLDVFVASLCTEPAPLRKNRRPSPIFPEGRGEGGGGWSVHRLVRGLSYHESPLAQGYIIILNSKCHGLPAVFSHLIRKHVLGCCCISGRTFKG